MLKLLTLFLLLGIASELCTAAIITPLTSFPTQSEINALKECSATLNTNLPVCVPPGFDLDFKTVAVWSKNYAKCCKAWETFYCLRDKTKQEAVCKGVIDTMLTTWASQVQTTFLANGCTPEHCLLVKYSKQAQRIN